ncbi:MAG: hypothetical protein IT339_01025 [Thermomicrobiales bacterium]|nr:hypothetical protein [Thermomicrobiales bacterium]
MFSLTEIDNVAWILLLLMGVWLAVNALVDLSSDRVSVRKSKESVDDRTDSRD